MIGALSIAYLLLAFLLAVGGGGLGASLGTSHRRLCALISLGAGTLLGVTLFAILPESLEALRWWAVLLALGSGYALFAVITKYVYHVCPACAASHFDEATTHRFSEIAAALMVGLASGRGFWPLDSAAQKSCCAWPPSKPLPCSAALWAGCSCAAPASSGWTY